MSLTSSLSIATQSLFAATAEIQNTNNNIANANTPGYTREVADLYTAPSSSTSGINPGNGVVLAGFQSVRSGLLQTQIEQGTQAQGQANAELSSLQQIQTIFNSSTQDIGSEMSALFSSISSLSTQPTSSSAREAVLAAGGNLTAAFNNASTALQQQQSGLNTQVGQDVDQINSLAQQIAALNPQIAVSGSKDAGTLQDQQNQLIVNLSKLTGLSITRTNDGVTIATSNGSPLVVGSKSSALKAVTGSDGMAHIFDSAGNDITDSIQGGELGGTIQVRDTDISGMLQQLDTLASQLASAFNNAQASGYDQNGNAGANFFSIPSGTAGSAGAISMAISDPALIAASSDGSSGSNGNLANLSAIQNNPLPSGQTPTDSYASLVYQVGSLTANANSQSTATAASMAQLTDQWNSVSGVSVDEEASNLVQFQQSYEAAARVITTVQALFQVTMTMGTAAAE